MLRDGEESGDRLEWAPTATQEGDAQEEGAEASARTLVWMSVAVT